MRAVRSNPCPLRSYDQRLRGHVRQVHPSGNEQQVPRPLLHPVPTRPLGIQTPRYWYMLPFPRVLGLRYRVHYFSATCHAYCCCTLSVATFNNHLTPPCHVLPVSPSLCRYCLSQPSIPPCLCSKLRSLVIVRTFSVGDSLWYLWAFEMSHIWRLSSSSVQSAKTFMCTRRTRHKVSVPWPA